MIYQFQYTSTGPEGKSNVYQKNALLPELAAVVDYQVRSVNIGAGINYLNLKPRTRSVVAGKTYKVDESLSSLSYMAYLKYTANLFSAGLKTVYGQNDTNLSMLGGYGIKSVDATTGKQEYSNFNQSSVWLNLAYGKKYKGNLLLGYTKNRGSEDALLEGSELYGQGLTIDDLYRVCGTFTYNISHFMLGIEYEFSYANYGDKETFDWKKGTYATAHGITGHRILGVLSYLF
jgi:hypothetical protein